MTFEVYKTCGCRFQMGFQFRFHPGLLRCRELIDAGRIGKPLSFRAEWGEYLPGWHPWEDYRKSYSARKDLGGGVLLTLSHPLDYIRWFFGDPEWIWAMNGKISDLELDVDDIAEIGMRDRDQLLCTARKALPAQVSHAVFGDDVIHVVLAGGADRTGRERGFDFADRAALRRRGKGNKALAAL